MKKQSFGIILAAVLGAGSLFSAVIPGTDALFNTALADPAVRKMTLIRTLQPPNFPLSWTRRIFSQMKKNPSFWISWKPSPGNTIWKWQLPQ